MMKSLLAFPKSHMSNDGSIHPKFQLNNMVQKIRKFEIILGESNLKISKNEKKSRIWASRSIYSKKKLSKGKIITISDVNFLRPGNKLSCSEF